MSLEPGKRYKIQSRVPSPEASVLPGVRELIEKAESEVIKLAWHRYLEQQPQCGFGLLGLCCRNCAMGPCRIDPFGYGPQRGVCGATADTIVARNLLRMIAAGAAAHSDHARDLVKVLRLVVEGKTKAYRITDSDKLRSVARALGIPVEKREDIEIAKDLVAILEREFGKQDEEPLALVKAFAPSRRISVWSKYGVVPRNIDREIVECMHRTHMV